MPESETILVAFTLDKNAEYRRLKGEEALNIALNDFLYDEDAEAGEWLSDYVYAIEKVEPPEMPTPSEAS